MKPVQLKIDYRSSWPQRLRQQVPKLVSYLLSSALIVTSIYFAKDQLAPIFSEKLKLSREIQHQQRIIQQAQAELAKLKFESPFSPNLTSQSNIVLRELCDSDTQVYLRILDQKLSRRLKFSAFQVDRENSPAQGFNFSMELSGQYSDFIPFLLNLENKFSFFQIKSMKMWPLSADNKYIGTVRMKLDGWLW